MAKKAAKAKQSTRRFFNALRASRERLFWFITAKGMIRARRAGGGASRAKAGGNTETFCPLTGPAFVKSKATMHLSDTIEAAEILGINNLTYPSEQNDGELDSFSDLVVQAADTKNKEPLLRQRILKTLDL